MDLELRWKCHCKNNNKMLISRSIRKHGKENFKIEEIDGANSMSELNYREQHHIYMNNSISPNGYNLTAGGENGKRSEETKLKISQIKIGKKLNLTEEQHKNRSERVSGKNNPMYGISLTGNKWPKERTLEFSKSRTGENHPLYGKKRSKETIRKCVENNKTRQPVLCVQNGIEYESFSEAERQLKITNIGSFFKGLCSNIKGLTFMKIDRKKK